MPTTKKWWQLTADPNVVGVETTETDGGGNVVGVSGVMQGDFTEITEVAYDAVIAALDLVPDPRPAIDAQLAADRAATATAAATAHTDLVGLGLSSATATFLTGHTP